MAGGQKGAEITLMSREKWMKEIKNSSEEEREVCTDQLGYKIFQTSASFNIPIPFWVFPTRSGLKSLCWANKDYRSVSQRAEVILSGAGELAAQGQQGWASSEHKAIKILNCY